MRVSIIGVNGYVGKNMSAYLTKRGFDIYGYGLLPDPFLEKGHYEVLDIRKPDDFKKLNTDVDFIFFCSGITGTSKAYDDYQDFIEVNETGLLNLLTCIRNNKSTARIVFPSTRLVYKGQKGIPLSEGAEKEFKTIYALNKWFGECMLKQYALYFGIHYTVFRICVPYGSVIDGQYSYGTIGVFLNKAANRQDILIYGDGSQMRTFTHMEDICFQMHQVLVNEISNEETYNIGGEVFSILDVAKGIAEKYAVQVKTQPWPELDRKIESGDTIFDDSKIRKMIPENFKNRFEEWLTTIQ